MSDNPTDEERLNNLMFQALDHAVASIADSGGPLVSFLIVEGSDGMKKLARCVTERLEEGESRVKQMVREARATAVRYAVAWDGFATIEGKRWDALFIEAGDKVAPTGVLLCQRYQKKGIFRKGIEPIGNPALIERPPSLFV